jgi:hypothetical protein
MASIPDFMPLIPGIVQVFHGFNSIMGVIRFLTKPNHYSFCTLVDFEHLLHLLGSLQFILLINTHCIDPESQGFVLVSKVLKGEEEAASDQELDPIAQNWKLWKRLAPGV